MTHSMRMSALQVMPALRSTMALDTPVTPLVREIDYADPVALFAPFAGDRYAALLDSALAGGPQGRYSFIAVEPFRVLTSKDGVIAIDGERSLGNPFEVLRRELSAHSLQPLPDLPPLQGGVV